VRQKAVEVWARDIANPDLVSFLGL